MVDGRTIYSERALKEKWNKQRDSIQWENTSLKEKKYIKTTYSWYMKLCLNGYVYDFLCFKVRFSYALKVTWLSRTLYIKYSHIFS